MPLYEYECQECEERFEKLVSGSPPPGSVRCPECGSPQVAKQFSAFAMSRASAGGGAQECCQTATTGFS
ncbi:MAG: zinc ribbon domain-containing protein [Chloroflexota bacterium]|nr:zinc ribbon domain-containing protein [Chloroflexota bacterium]